MKTLALEFSSSHRTAAVLVDGAVRGRAAESERKESRPIALIRQALQEARCCQADVKRIAIGLGPGSFTGIRAAIALAQGWQLASGVELIGVSSLDALAETARRERVYGRVNLVVDAQRGEFHLLRRDVSADGIRPVDGLQLIPVSELQARMAAGEIVAGPDITKRLPGGLEIFPDAAVVGRLASEVSRSVPAAELAPIFLRHATFTKAPAARPIPPL